MIWPVLLVIGMALPGAIWARSPSLDDRLARLENILENELNVGILNHIELMQQEVRELRGKIEEQQNELQLLNKKQEKLYVSLETRLNSLSMTNDTKEIVSVLETENKDSEKYCYDTAYRFIVVKQYADAIAGLKSLISRFPKGTYVANANYWLGEIYLAQWQESKANKALLKQAVDSFNVVINDHPTHHKAADALLKLGMVEMERENWLAAENILNQVIDKYPGSSRSALAELKLKHMKQAEPGR